MPVSFAAHIGKEDVFGSGLVEYPQRDARSRPHAGLGDAVNGDCHIGPFRCRKGGHDTECGAGPPLLSGRPDELHNAVAGDGVNVAQPTFEERGIRLVFVCVDGARRKVVGKDHGGNLGGGLREADQRAENSRRNEEVPEQVTGVQERGRARSRSVKEVVVSHRLRPFGFQRRHFQTPARNRTSRSADGVKKGNNRQLCDADGGGKSNFEFVDRVTSSRRGSGRCRFHRTWRSKHVFARLIPDYCRSDAQRNVTEGRRADRVKASRGQHRGKATAEWTWETEFQRAIVRAEHEGGGHGRKR